MNTQLTTSEIAAIAAAQRCGCRTKYDKPIASAWGEIAFRDPSGWHVLRTYSHDWIDDINNDEIKIALREMQSIANRRDIGYGWGRPCTGSAFNVAEQLAITDDLRYESARRIVISWLKETASHVLVKHNDLLVSNEPFDKRQWPGAK